MCAPCTNLRAGRFEKSVVKPSTCVNERPAGTVKAEYHLCNRYVHVSQSSGFFITVVQTPNINICRPLTLTTYNGYAQLLYFQFVALLSDPNIAMRDVAFVFHCPLR